jgi:hypothetical protein
VISRLSVPGSACAGSGNCSLQVLHWTMRVALVAWGLRLLLLAPGGGYRGAGCGSGAGCGGVRGSTSNLTALTLALDLLEGRRVGCSDEARRGGTLDREVRLAERVQLLVHALAQVSHCLLVLAVVDART